MKLDQDLVHVYFMPGMAVDSSIFGHIILPEYYIVHYLEWEIPETNQSLKDYAKNMLQYVKEDNPVLIGVSFGGVIIQEMAKLISVRRLIIISSVKCAAELPSRMKFAAKTGIFKLIPTGLVNYIDFFEKIAFGEFLKKRAKLYRQYLSIKDKKYLNWAIRHMVTWDCAKPVENVVHIHGDQDIVFPIKNIENCIVVPGGTHIMIVNRFRWFNEYLPEIIATGKIEKESINQLKN